MSATTHPLLYEAVRYLAGHCDGARARDGQGYNGLDTSFGHSLAATPAEAWTPKMQSAAYRMIQKYRVQLAGGGIDIHLIPQPQAPAREAGSVTVTPDGLTVIIRFPYDKALVEAVKREVPGARWDREARYWYALADRAPQAIAFAERHGLRVEEAGIRAAAQVAPPAPADAPPPTAERTISLEDGGFIIRFPYDAGLVAAVKREIPTRRWDGAARVWRASRGDAPRVIRFAGAYGFRLPESLEADLAAERAEREARRAASRAEDADLDVPGLGVTLYPFQRAGVRYALQSRRCFIADEMGLGKTYQALATVQAADAYPALVIVPASLKLNWEREARRALPDATIEVLNGAPGRYDADVTIINYEMLRRHIDGLEARGHRALIVDEAHYVKNRRAQRTQFVQRLAAGTDIRLLLTGTPVMNRPDELIAPLTVLDRLNDLGGWRQFTTRYCGAYRDRFGFHTDGAGNLQELNDRLRETCFVRRRKADVLTELPPKSRGPVAVPLANAAEYARAEADTVRWLGEQAEADAEFLASIAHLPADEQRRERAERRGSAEQRARRAEQLVRINALKQVAARGKLPAAVAWVEEFLEGSEEKILIFAYHQAVQRALIDAFPGCARVYADDSLAVRQANVDRFQDDPACRVAVCSITAGGLGLTLTAASNVAFVEQAWTPAAHDQAEDRAHRIGQRDTVTAYYLTAPGTIDEDIADLIQAKRLVVDAASDGALDETGDASILPELVERMISGAGR